MLEQYVEENKINTKEKEERFVGRPFENLKSLHIPIQYNSYADGM